MKRPLHDSSVDLERVHKALKSKFKDKKLIFGGGEIDADIIFVCEMPGLDEHNESKPLTGRSEKFLYQLMRAAGIDKKKVYVTNVVKYFPNGKMPTPKEIKSHSLFLKEEIKSINPKIVVTLGNIALNGVGLRQPLTNVHGRTFNFGSYELLPTYHPETALADLQIKGLLELDFRKLKDLLKKPKEIGGAL